MVALTILLVFASAFFAGIIGVQLIFGAFLPLYFALSGLNTNTGLLDTGITWAYAVAVTVVAFVGKFLGGTIAARLCKMFWRESLTVGVLMSCKGLIELIVLVT